MRLICDLTPHVSDGVSLGTGSLMFSDLFLASGSVVNFNNGDMTITHASNKLTVAGGTLVFAFDANDYTIADGATFADSSDNTILSFADDAITLAASTATVSGVLDITGTTDSSNATGDTGILRCEGGASIAKKLYVGSTITGSADVIAFSDRKLKENIETLDGKKVLDMRGVSFTRKDSGKKSSGVIAQEIQEVAPELVVDTEGTLGVAYGNLVGYLIEAVKDQQKQIDELKAMINGSSK